ncbi:MAG: calcium-binding protein [Methyloceanibacter sp.]|uniref:calcium-binding protein n=1 Tax=Methyloceanibacter sp. TaxID=1965321 RepID=UPI003D6D9C64
MAWQIPQSVTQAGTVADLGTTDSVFVASGVTIASTASTTIFGTGSSNEVLVYGTVATTASIAIRLGGGTVTISPGGQVHTFGVASLAIVFFEANSHLTNAGLISAPTGTGIRIGGISATTTSTIDNSGTIDATSFAIFGSNGTTETILLQNSGEISGDGAAYSRTGAVARDVVTNTGQMIGDILLGPGNDAYNGAQGRLSGDVLAGDGNDVVTGGIDNDIFFGDAGNDALNGGFGNDTLNGGAGNDVLTGGSGRDTLFGGLDADRFDFNSAKESVKGGNRDRIMDFNRGQGDKIDLKDIDAESGGGNQKFTWIGKSKFHDEKGELRYIDKGATVIVQGDVNGDGKADFEIFVNVGALAKGDFIL